MAVLEIKARTMLGHQFTTDKEGLKKHYKSWADGALNVSRYDRPLYYFSHYILSGIDYRGFLELIQEA